MPEEKARQPPPAGLLYFQKPVEYNHLNLPSKVTFGDGNWIEWVYDANGKKLRKTTSPGSTKEYIDGIEYKGPNIEAVYHAEGRAYNPASEFTGTLPLVGTQTGNEDHSAAIIESTQVLEPGAMSEYRATLYITMSDGFHVKPGAEFHARIVPAPASGWRYEYSRCVKPSQLFQVFRRVLARCHLQPAML